LSPAIGLFLVRFIVPFLGGLIAMASDIRERRIPNWISVSLLATGLVFRTITFGWAGLADSLGGFATGFAILFVLYAIGGGGAGDVKFMAGVGAWLGPYHVTMVFVLSAIIVLLYTVITLIIRLGLGDGTNSVQPHTDGKETVKKFSILRDRLPYAVPATLAIALRLGWLLLIGRTT
jgi:prepilin peptidase CpaA